VSGFTGPWSAASFDFDWAVWIRWEHLTDPEGPSKS
jgi:hypothetical protein